MTIKRKRILYLSNSYPATVSGVTTVVGNLLRWMSKQYDVAVVCPNAKTQYAKRVIDGIVHYQLPSYPTLIRKDVRFITPNPLQIQKAFDDFRPDNIHLHDPSPSSIVLKEMAIKNNIPVLFSHHFTSQMVLGYLPEGLKTAAQNNDNLNNTILQLTCKVYENADRIVVPTQTVCSELANFTQIPISVISSGIDNKQFQTRDVTQIEKVSNTYQLPNKPFCLYVGRLDPDKDLNILLEAWSRVKNNAEFGLVIAGDGGSAGKLKELAVVLDIDAQITWTGMIPQNQLGHLYNNPNAKVFVITSSIESQSIVTLMALASGLPVVAANSGALPEIVIDGKSGYLCTKNNVSEFSDRISFLLSHPEQAKKIGAFGSKIASRHDFRDVISNYQILYEKAFLLHHHSHT